MGWSGSWFSFWCGASAVGMGPGNESTFQGLKAADTAMPTSGLFCLFNRSHMSNLCASGEEVGVSGDPGNHGSQRLGTVELYFSGHPEVTCPLGHLAPCPGRSLAVVSPFRWASESGSSPASKWG